MKRRRRSEKRYRVPLSLEVLEATEMDTECPLCATPMVRITYTTNVGHAVQAIITMEACEDDDFCGFTREAHDVQT